MSVKVADLTYPRHVSEEIDLLARALGFACQVFLFVDYGGTLSSGDASGRQRPNDDVLLKLGQLAAEPSFSVFVLSGRTVGELGELIGLEDVGLIGQRGLEIRRAHSKIEYPSDASSLERLIDHLELDAHRRLAAFDGYSIENRGFALTLRMDGCDPCRTKEISQSFVRVVGDVDRHGRMEVLYGPSSIEARVAEWHKGDAVRHILREADIEDSLAIYIGDDVTDEDAFEAVDDWADTDGADAPWFMPEQDDGEGDPIQALTILVSPEPRPTRASLFVRGPEEVYEFLSSLATIAAALL